MIPNNLSMYFLYFTEEFCHRTILMEAEDNKSAFLDRRKKGKLHSLYFTDLRQKKRKLYKSKLEVAIKF